MKPRVPLTALALGALLVAATALVPRPARADLGTDASERLQRLKQVQHELLLREPFAERRELAQRYRELKQLRARAAARAKRAAAGERLRPSPDTRAGNETRAAQMARIARASSPASSQALATNVLVNDPSSDLFTDTAQSEVSIAADGNNMVVAWNDGNGLNYSPYHDAQGYGYSTDGGVTWTDGGAFPTPGTLVWFSDPVVTVNNKTHEFYFSALVLDPNDLANGQNGVGVVKGTFSGGAIHWGTPVIPIQGAGSTYVFDKEWMAADSLQNIVYVPYVRFFVGGDQIEFVASSDGGVTWSVPRVLSSTPDKGYVQAPRVVISPAGLAHFVWYAIGNSALSAWGRDYFRARTFTPPVSTGLLGAQFTVDSMFVDFGNGGPGFNRGNAFAFPGAALDRTTGPHRGRMFVSWNEAVDFYNSADDIGYHLPFVQETVDYGGAVSTARTVAVGDRIHGSISNGTDQDWFKFAGTKDSTVIVFCDSVTGTLEPEMKLFGPDGIQELGFVNGGQDQSILIVYTLPVTGNYALRVRATGGSATTGNYSVFTGYHRPQPAPENDRARDHRDIFVKYNDTPTGAWPATTVQVNSNPPDYDDWLPEVAIGGNGKPYVAWYDFHDHDPSLFAGSGSTVYLSRSDDGGTTWSAGSPVSDQTTYWWEVASNIAPNQGDYIALTGTPTGLLAGWGDGRLGSPDVFFANVDMAFVAVQMSLVSANASPGKVALEWQATDANGLVATLQRHGPTGDWAPITTLVTSGTGLLSYTDTDVSPGRWGYRLSWIEGNVPKTSAETWVDVPSDAFALKLMTPNPSNDGIRVQFTLPVAGPATLELLDISGRVLTRIDASGYGAGSHLADLAPTRRLPAGVYLVRLSQGARHSVMRTSVVR